ncbi:MAG: GxxExxY protein, partial [Spirochaetaceae bacterium]|nr:GxxExxY protein [Spirochaetaceae bacterium]
QAHKGKKDDYARTRKTRQNVLDCAYEVHSFLGPGLLESTCQTCLPHEVTQQGIFVEYEKSIPVLYKGTAFDCAYCIDMMVEHGQLPIENKGVKEFTDVHPAQMLPYLKLSGISLGFCSISMYSPLKPEYGESFSNPSFVRLCGFLSSFVFVGQV